MSIRGHQHCRTPILYVHVRLFTRVRAGMYMSECKRVFMDVYVLLSFRSKQAYVTHSCSYLLLMALTFAVAKYLGRR